MARYRNPLRNVIKLLQTFFTRLVLTHVPIEKGEISILHFDQAFKLILMSDRSCSRRKVRNKKRWGESTNINNIPPPNPLRSINAREKSRSELRNLIFF